MIRIKWSFYYQKTLLLVYTLYFFNYRGKLVHKLPTLAWSREGPPPIGYDVDNLFSNYIDHTEITLPFLFFNNFF